MERFHSDPLPLSPAIREGLFTSANLIFYGVDHSGPSFKAAVFLNVAEVGLETPLDPEVGYAGSFTILGHGGCFGDEGHCHVPSYEKDPFDSRPLHSLTPLTKMVDVTEALRRVAPDRAQLEVAVLPIVPGIEAAEVDDVLHFSAMRLVAYD